MDVQALLNLIEAAHPARGFTFVGIGGHGGAGKTTLAAAIPGAQVVGTDAFWDGSEFELTRLLREVVSPLLDGAGASFRAYDWSTGRDAPEPKVIEPTGIVVIEGVCALHRMLRHAYDVRVWVDAPRALRLERGVARDGEAARERWETVWMPAEERYVARDRPVAAAHLVIDGSG